MLLLLRISFRDLVHSNKLVPNNFRYQSRLISDSKTTYNFDEIQENLNMTEFSDVIYKSVDCILEELKKPKVKY